MQYPKYHINLKIKRGFAIGFQGSFNGVHLYRMSTVDEEIYFDREI